MKAAILLATYNKLECLPNTFYSIKRQETSFPVEVCIVDDRSDFPGPERFVQFFLPDAKYKRLEKHVGTQFSQSKCLELISDDTDIVIIQSCDVMYLQDDLIEKLCEGVTDGKFAMAGVKNVSVPIDYWRDRETGIQQLNQEYESTQGINIYSGTGRPSRDWLLFLGAMTVNDAYKIDFDFRCCDVVVQQRIREEGLQPIFRDDLHAIHQLHPPAHRWPCSIVDSCEYWCSRKGV